MTASRTWWPCAGQWQAWILALLECLAMYSSLLQRCSTPSLAWWKLSCRARCHSWSSQVLFRGRVWPPSEADISVFQQQWMLYRSGKNDNSPINALVQQLHSKPRGAVCAWGSAADQKLSRQPLFAQLLRSEKSPEAVGCPVQFAALSLG